MLNIAHFRRSHGSGSANDRSALDGGFTLIEVLVAVSIIAVLIGISFPALRGVRKTSEIAACLSNQRTIGVAYSMYVAEQNGSLPIYDFQRDPDGVIRHELRTESWGYWPESAVYGGIVILLPTDHAYLWAYPLRTYLTEEAQNTGFQAEQITACPRHYQNKKKSDVADPLVFGAESYTQSPALFTRTDVWSGTHDVVVNRDYAAVKLASVAHPSNKALLVERASFHGARAVEIWNEESERFNVLAVDGHAERRRAEDSRETVKIVGERAGGLFCGWNNNPTPYLTTARGAAGVDW